MHVRRRRTSPYWDMKEFLELKDEDLKNFIFMQRRVGTSFTETKMKDDDEKTGWYLITYTLKQNNQGKFYRHSSIKEYLVYDKKKKKARVSPIHINVKKEFLKEYFKYSELIEQYFIWRLSPTFCKKVVEGKIATISDIVKYHRSYTVRNKNISLETLYKVIVWKGLGVLPVIEDPENISSQTELDSIMNKIGTSKPFKIKVEDIPTLGEKYAEWNREQDKKYAELTGRGVQENCAVFGSESKF